MKFEYLYEHSGLSIHSEIFIPEWEMFAAEDSRPADIRFLIGSVPAFEENGWAHEVSADEYRFAVPEIGRYRITCDTIIVEAAPGADERTVRVFLLGSCMGALYYLRNLICLHASIVKTDQGAVAFCGPSGSGKSTMAAHLMARGTRLICDDLCRVSFTGEGQVTVYPSSIRLKLWSDALETLGWSSASLARDHIRMDKYHVPLESNSKTLPTPLARIYLPVWGERRTTRLRGMNALRSLIAGGAYRADLLEPMERLPLLWERFAQIVQRVPVFELSRPCDISHMSEICEELIAE